MAKRYDIIVRVISRKGECAQEHNVGDEWLLRSKTPEGICLSAFLNLLPAARVMMFDGTFPWANDPDVFTVGCPDMTNQVVFELRRVER